MSKAFIRGTTKRFDAIQIPSQPSSSALNSLDDAISMEAVIHLLITVFSPYSVKGFQ